MRTELADNVSTSESIACIVQIYEESSHLTQHFWTDYIKAFDIESMALYFLTSIREIISPPSLAMSCKVAILLTVT